MADDPADRTGREGAGTDAGAAGATGREQIPGHDIGDPSAQTGREGSVDSGGGQPPLTVLDGRLPPPLERFEDVRPIDVASYQADVYRARDPDDGQLRFIKLYHAGTPIDEDALGRAATIPAEHVARHEGSGDLVDRGRHRYYEIQEWISGGSLTTLLERNGERGLASDMLHDIIIDFHAAIMAMHERGLAHLDLKPDNVLIRAEDPLDVVLADFGLATISSVDDVVLSSMRGTPMYSPPESMSLQGGFKWDYWSFGLVIATLAAGHHPLEGLGRAAVLQFKNTYTPFDFSSIPDARVRSLCAGLTRYDTEIRWGPTEVDAWLAGDDPPVEDDLAITSSLQADDTGVLFGGARYTEPTELAAALGADPHAATLILGRPVRREEFTDDLEEFMWVESVRPLLVSWERKFPPVPVAIVDLIFALDPNATPRHGNIPISPDGLRSLIGIASAPDETPEKTQAAAFIEDLWRFDLLPRYGTGSPELVEIHNRWHTYVDDALAALRSPNVGTPRSLGPSDRIELLWCAVDGTLTPLLRDQLRAVDTHSARSQPWFAQLLDRAQENPGSAFAARDLAPVAEGEHSRQVANEKRAAEERRAAAKTQAQNLRQRDIRTLRWTLYWILIVPLPLGIGIYRLYNQMDLPTGPLGNVVYLTDATPMDLFLAVVLAGAFIGPLLVGLTLVLRRPFRHRGFGQGCGVALLVIAIVGYNFGGSNLHDKVALAQWSVATHPAPLDFFDQCHSSTSGFNVPQYWTNKNDATRTFVDESCRKVIQLKGVGTAWTAPQNAQVDLLAGIDHTFVVLEDNATVMVSLDHATGKTLWSKKCADGFSLDTSQFDAGDDTPDNQRVAGTCGDATFSYDPGTGA